MVQPLTSSIELQITKLLATLAEYKASDLHLSVGNTPMLRVAGKLISLTGEELLTPEFIQTVVDSFLNPEQVKQLSVYRDIVFSHTFKGKTRYKVHVYYQQGYPSISFRLIPNTIQPITQFDVPDQVKNVAQYLNGLVIIAGPYGAGKTTVLASMIEYYNQTFEKHIVTFEQPIEILFTDAKAIVEQREIGRDVPNTAAVQDFANKEDVDIVMISNVNDEASVLAALHVAEMGKLVFIEVTADSVQLALERIVSMVAIEHETHIRSALASTLRSVVVLQAMPNNAGGVSLATEVLLMSPGVLTMLRQDTFDKVNTIIENAQNEGMLSMQQSVNLLAQSGKINPRL